MRHAVIMAGGAGVRLWPLSRKNRPKQILRLFSGTSLLRQSYERVAAMMQPEQINVITNRSHLPIVSQELPELPSANVIGEPEGRDTANAVGLTAAILARHHCSSLTLSADFARLTDRQARGPLRPCRSRPSSGDSWNDRQWTLDL